MTLHKANYKLLFLFGLPILLNACAQPELIYQQPAPVYRPKKAPLAKLKPAPKPKPKVETFKLPAEPLVGEEIKPAEPTPSEAITPLPAVPEAPTSSESAPTAPPAPAPAETPAPAPAPVAPPAVESADRAGYSAPPVNVSGSPAVLALLGDAERNSRKGDLDAAAATIERALRIDSRNAGLLYKLAQIRLKQNQPRLAEDLAKKSQLYAGNNRELKKNSWMLIATARYMQGDKQGANEAREKANQF